jgi:Xaa-Pro aminopeptidase
MRPGEQDLLWVQFYNHLPAATEMASEAEVRWGGHRTAETVVEALDGAGVDRLGLIGPIGWKLHARLAATAELIDLGGEYARLRMVKSAEEMAWMRTGAELSDRAILALKDAAKPGVDERELGAAVEGAYLALGGTNHIHYFGATSMAHPDRCVPSQWPSNRRLEAGDVLTTEISAAWWGYAGQILRSIAIAAEPTDHYLELQRVADAAFDAIVGVLRHGATPQEVVDASGVIEDAGFTIYDDLVHGFGGGYFEPILGSRSRPNGPLTDVVFEAGMTVVVQPNVITPDERMGVQTGALVAITEDGVEELHKVPRGLWRAG